MAHCGAEAHADLFFAFSESIYLKCLAMIMMGGALQGVDEWC